jgi:nucleotide-binding universal stress UspA family protein
VLPLPHQSGYSRCPMQKGFRGAGDQPGRQSGDTPRDQDLLGDAAAVIQEMAERSGEPTLVAIGRRGLGAVRYSTLGGVSADVLRSVSGAVLIVSLPDEP